MSNASEFWKNRRQYHKDRRIEIDGFLISPDVPLIVHGTTTGKNYYMCECPTCIDFKLPTKDKRDAKALIIKANIIHDSVLFFEALDYILKELRTK